MEDLQELRKQIDQIDQEMVRLFEARMDVCRQVAEYKIANGKKVLDRSRELEKLDTAWGACNTEHLYHGFDMGFHAAIRLIFEKPAGIQRH